MQQIQWNSEVLDLSRLMEMGADRPGLVERYLRQFQSIVPERVDKLEAAAAQADRVAIRQIVHQMKPQLLFFGLPIPSGDYELLLDPSIPCGDEELRKRVHQFNQTLSKALGAVDQILESYFSS